MDQEARASDQDRESTVARLKTAYADGRLAPGEMEQRVERALTAVSHGDLAALTADLPERPGEVVTIRTRSGRVVRKGAWRVPRTLRVEAEYAHPHFDLSEAVIEHDRIDVELDLAYGSATIVLPPGATADADGVQTDWGGVFSKVPGAPVPGRPHLRVTGRLGYGRLRIRYPATGRFRWLKR
ncbi:DUF1707 domain-containing protein [Herbidospora sp. NEAU-GS84]|uniref:DUF1707 domain-containing protein n=1 Tax=Herbidospora solisilvae TaxID=2696284 RepID=A0A7C9J7J0_9ACTN|nr:DUF1707 domain-containing protein [Herbidospora solisilvae]NAS21728.1 DUF1707 domain-containing protein [Herbidospora solisilvae]